MREGWAKPLWLKNIMDKHQEVILAKLEDVQNLFSTSGDADALAGDILSGKKAYNGTTLITGTMADNGAMNANIAAGGQYNIPVGYHNGQGKVTAADLASQTPGTANAENILTGLTAWVAGVKKTGSMTDNGAVSEQINCGETYTVPAGYHNGQGTVSTADLASQTEGTATAANILTGNTAWVSGVKMTGTMSNMSGTTVTASAVSQDSSYTYLTVPSSGYYSTSSKLRTGNNNLQQWAYGSGTTPAAGATKSYTCGFKPSYLCFYSLTGKVAFIYNASVSTTVFQFYTSTGLLSNRTIGINGTCIKSIDSTGFTLFVSSDSAAGSKASYWFAIK